MLCFALYITPNSQRCIVMSQRTKQVHSQRNTCSIKHSSLAPLSIMSYLATGTDRRAKAGLRVPEKGNNHGQLEEAVQIEHC